MSSRMLPLSVLATTLLMAGCRDPQIESYRIAKETDSAPPAKAAAPRAAPSPAPSPAPAPEPTMANTAVPTADGPGLAWTAPEHWVAKPASAMRKGTFTITDEAGATADLSITAFPGNVGGDLANINRWRGQIQLPPIAAAELAAATSTVESQGLKLTVVYFTGGPAATLQRVLGAIVPVGDSTWFFKLTGPAALVAREQPAFAAYLKTIRPAGATP